MMLVTTNEERWYRACKNTHFHIVILCSVSLIFATEVLLGVYVYKAKSEIHNVYLKELRTETWRNEIRQLLSDREFCEMYGCLKKNTEVSITNLSRRKRENGICLELIDEGCLVKGEPGLPGSPGLWGPMGPKADKGEPGISGQHGIPGDPGNPGPPGEKGVTGQIGQQGNPGPPGEKGVTGQRGPMGPKADKGEQGISGQHGIPGDPGNPGPPGEKGVTGQIGPMGPKGEQGISGQHGIPGEPGHPGPLGEKGVTGQIGPMGPKADKGEQGVSGQHGIPGVPGNSGLPGEKGVTGQIGPMGPKGDKGEQGISGQHGIPGVPGRPGPPGEKGVTGQIGPMGPKADNGGQGFSGAPGTPGVPGHSGSPGEKGVTGLTGPKGSKGDKGNSGTSGLPGLKGDHGLAEKGTLGTAGVPGHSGSTRPPRPMRPKGDPEIDYLTLKGAHGLTELLSEKGYRPWSPLEEADDGIYDWRCLGSNGIGNYYDNNPDYYDLSLPGLPERNTKCLITQSSFCRTEQDFKGRQRILSTSDDKEYYWNDSSRANLNFYDDFGRKYRLYGITSRDRMGHASVVIGRSLFYYAVSKRTDILTIFKLDLSTNAREEVKIPKRYIQNFNYLFYDGEHNPVEIKVDENGLWIMLYIKTSGIVDVATVIKIGGKKLEIEAVIEVDLKDKYFDGTFIVSGILYGFMSDESSFGEITFVLDLYTCRLASTTANVDRGLDDFAYPASMYYPGTKTLKVGNGIKEIDNYWICHIDCLWGSF